MTLSTKEKNKPRFSAGKLVMLSRKNVKSGAIPYFYFRGEKQKNNNVFDWTMQHGSYSRPAGFLGRGVPVLLIKNPEYLNSIDDFKFRIYTGIRTKKIWRLVILLEEQKYVIYLSGTQYRHELVRAVPRRLNKDYSKCVRRKKDM